MTCRFYSLLVTRLYFRISAYCTITWSLEEICLCDTHDVQIHEATLWFSSYYCKLIPAHADLVKPLTQLSGKMIPFIWRGQYQKSFQLFKEALMRSPILLHPYPNKTYTLFKVYLVCIVNRGIYHVHWW